MRQQPARGAGMTRKYFGTDGVRGTANRWPMDVETVLKTGLAAGSLYSRGAHRHRVVIGKDTRLSGYMLEQALTAGFLATGMDVFLFGPVPTPAVAMLTRSLRADIGVMISASHNPYDDNGIKLFGPDGYKLSDAQEQDIERLIESDHGAKLAPSDKIGRAKRIEDAQARYIESVKRTFPKELLLESLRIVVDTANGAAYHIAEHVLHELGADVVTMGNTPDGYNINKEVGATAPRALRAAVIEHRADLGIALDGDADRLVMVDARGIEYDGDQLLYAIAATAHKNHPITGVVGTLMSNLGLEKAFEKLGIAFARANVGDRYVLEQLKERGWVYGGESSGHILCLDKHTTGDGMVSALQVLSAIRRSNKSLAELVAPVHMYPQTMINVRVTKGFDWKNHAPLNAARAQAEEALGDTGRILIRASGTEPLIRVMVEAQDAEKARTQAQLMADALGQK